jgi:hypothetical protein
MRYMISPMFNPLLLVILLLLCTPFGVPAQRQV